MKTPRHANAWSSVFILLVILSSPCIVASNSLYRPAHPLPTIVPSDVAAEAVALVGWFSGVSWPRDDDLRDDRILGDPKILDASPYLPLSIFRNWRAVKLPQAYPAVPYDKPHQNGNSPLDSTGKLRVFPEQVKRNSRRFRHGFFASKEGSKNESFFQNEDFNANIGNNNSVLLNFSTMKPKRKICCNNEGACRTCLAGVDADEVVDHYFDFFADVPRSLVDFSGLGVEQTEHCSRLDIPLFQVNLRQMVVSPSWVRDVRHMGWCPSVFITRDLGPNSFPAKLIEVKCLCDRSKCSRRGADFRCLSVHKMVATWVRFGGVAGEGKPYAPEMTRVRIGCVCAQRPAQWGGEMNSIFALN